MTLVFLVVVSVSVLSAVVLFPLLELRDCRLVGGFCAPLTAAVLLSSLAGRVDARELSFSPLPLFGCDCSALLRH